MKKVIIGFIVVVVLIVVVGMFVSDSENYESLIEESNAVLLVDQKSGEETTVSYAKLSQPGYILVFNTPLETGVKEVIGSSALLEAGEYRNVRVLHKGNSHGSGSRISASIIADDGDGVFDSESDTESLTEESEAIVDEEAIDPEDLSDEDIIGLLDEEGYDINEKAVENVFDFEDKNDDIENDDSLEQDDDSSDMEDGSEEDNSNDIEEESFDDNMTEEDPVQE